MSFTEKFLAVLILVLTGVFGSITYLSFTGKTDISNAKTNSEVLGVVEIENPKTDDVSLNSFLPADIEPPSIDIPDSDDFNDINNSNQDNSGIVTTTAPNLPIQNIESTIEGEDTEIEIEDIHDLLEEQVEIAYNPEQIISAPEKSGKELKYFTPEEVFVQESNPDNVVGFTDSTVSHNSANVEVNGSITLTLPDHFNDNNKLIDNLKFYPEIQFDKSIDGNQLTITPINQRRDTQYIFGLQTQPICFTNVQDCNVEPKESWSYALGYSTAVWQDTVYGTSVQGRNLKGTLLGKCRTTSCKKIMLTGGLHGSEWRSGDLTQLISYIKTNPAEISGQDKEFYIIPFTNPDGTALNNRYNARGVNLNRNFPGWVSCPQCGSGPNSEPEAQALHDATWFWRPNYLISYHAQWPPNGIIFRGDDNDQGTRDFAQWVADRTGYPVGEFPDFDVVPGDQTVWANSQGIKSIIIEATYVANSDWDKNFNMYLAMLREL